MKGGRGGCLGERTDRCGDRGGSWRPTGAACEATCKQRYPGVMGVREVRSPCPIKAGGRRRLCRPFGTPRGRSSRLPPHPSGKPARLPAVPRSAPSGAAAPREDRDTPSQAGASPVGSGEATALAVRAARLPSPFSVPPPPPDVSGVGGGTRPQTPHPFPR